MILKSYQIILILSLFYFSTQFFDDDTKVIQLDKNNFDKKVLRSDYLWFIIFYAPWCVHCQQFHPELENIAKATKGLFKIGAVNCEEQKELAAKYNIPGFPTLLFFGEDKIKFEVYGGDRDGEKVIEYLIEKAKSASLSKFKKLKKEKIEKINPKKEDKTEKKDKKEKKHKKDKKEKKNKKDKKNKDKHDEL